MFVSMLNVELKLHFFWTTGVLILAQFLRFGDASAAPEDWVSGSPFTHYSPDDSRADTFTSAYLNVTFMTEDGWKWDKTDVGRYGGGYVGEYHFLHLQNVDSSIMINYWHLI